MRKVREARRRETVKQMFILADLVALSFLTGRSRSRVITRPTVETPNRTYVIILCASAYPRSISYADWGGIGLSPSRICPA